MRNRTLLLLHLLLLAVLWGVAFLTNGMGGGGDSLTHYFMSRLSWSQPHFFLDLWGKPVFTLLSSPFAQLGFIGLKLFNVCCGVMASFFSCLVARQLHKQWHWSILLIAFIAPAFYTYLFSGLTEPLAALLSIIAVWLCLSGRVALGFVLASFLPFARTEAEVFLVFFFLFGIFNKEFKKLPLLLTAYIVFSVIGGFIYGDFLWIFTSPYDSGGSVYGHGEWYHYLNRLRIMLAIPGLILATLGLVRFFIRWFQHQINWKTEPWLIHGMFFSLLFGHSLVWTLGIYGSAGLERTLLTAFPFLWIVMLDGVLLLRDISIRIFRRAPYALPLLLLFIQVAAFVRSPYTYYYWDSNLSPGAENNYFENHVAAYIKKYYPNAHRFVMDKPDMAISLNANFMDFHDRLNWSSYQDVANVPDSVLWIFDSYYVPVQYGIPLERIEKEQKLKEIRRFQSPEGSLYILFEKNKDQ